MPYDPYAPRGDYYGQLARSQQQYDVWAPSQQGSQPQSDPWSIPTVPPPKPLDQSPPITSAEMDAIIQQSQAGTSQPPVATVNLSPSQFSQYGKKEPAPDTSTTSNYAGWGRYAGGY